MLTPGDRSDAPEVSMSDEQALIPPPPVIRERLARNIKERRILRSLLRLSILEDEQRHRRQDGGGLPPPQGSPCCAGQPGEKHL
jgi:hypothetical protein